MMFPEDIYDGAVDHEMSFYSINRICCHTQETLGDINS